MNRISLAWHCDKYVRAIPPGQVAPSVFSASLGRAATACGALQYAAVAVCPGCIAASTARLTCTQSSVTTV